MYSTFLFFSAISREYSCRPAEVSTGPPVIQERPWISTNTLSLERPDDTEGSGIPWTSVRAVTAGEQGRSRTDQEPSFRFFVPVAQENRPVYLTDHNIQTVVEPAISLRASAEQGRRQVVWSLEYSVTIYGPSAPAD